MNFDMSVPIVTTIVAMATVLLTFKEAHVKHTAFFLGAYVFTLLAVKLVIISEHNLVILSP